MGARTISFVDINQDQKPDIVASGSFEIGNNDSSFVSVFLNTFGNDNLKPTPPTVLESFAISNRVIFNWGDGQDDIGSNQALRYNLSISRVIIENDVRTLLSSATSYNSSNTGTKLIREFTGIPWGNYIWKVQTIDPSGVVSEWSNEKELFIPRLVKSFQSIPGYSLSLIHISEPTRRM